MFQGSLSQYLLNPISEDVKVLPKRESSNSSTFGTAERQGQAKRPSRKLPRLKMGSPVEKTSSCATYFYIGGVAQSCQRCAIGPCMVLICADDEIRLVNLYWLWEKLTLNSSTGFGLLKIWCMGSQIFR